MSRRRKKRSTGRRRRVGAMALNANSPMVQIAALAAGYLLVGNPLNAAIDKMTAGKVSGKIVGAAEAGLGAMLLLKKGEKSLPQTLAGGVLAGAGLKRLLTEFGVVTGFQAVPVLGRVNGYGRIPVLGNTAAPGYPVGNGITGSGYTTTSQKVMGSCADDGGSGFNADDL